MTKVYSASEILPYLFLGSLYTSRNRELLNSLGVTHILNVKESMRFEDCEYFKYLHLPLSDYGITSLIEIFPKCFDFIENAKLAGGKTLVHCRYGMNRSPTIVIAYLMKSQGWSLDESLLYVRNLHQQVMPHENYIIQLKKFESDLIGNL